MFPPGGELSVFPNSEEKFQHLLFNLHRMFTNYSLDIDIGKYSNYHIMTLKAQITVVEQMHLVNHYIGILISCMGY